MPEQHVPRLRQRRRRGAVHQRAQRAHGPEQDRVSAVGARTHRVLVDRAERDEGDEDVREGVRRLLPVVLGHRHAPRALALVPHLEQVGSRGGGRSGWGWRIRRRRPRAEVAPSPLRIGRLRAFGAFGLQQPRRERVLRRHDHVSQRAGPRERAEGAPRARRPRAPSCHVRQPSASHPEHPRHRLRPRAKHRRRRRRPLARRRRRAHVPSFRWHRHHQQHHARVPRDDAARARAGKRLLEPSHEIVVLHVGVGRELRQRTPVHRRPTRGRGAGAQGEERAGKADARGARLRRGSERPRQRGRRDHPTAAVEPRGLQVELVGVLVVARPHLDPRDAARVLGEVAQRVHDRVPVGVLRGDARQSFVSAEAAAIVFVGGGGGGGGGVGATDAPRGLARDDARDLAPGERDVNRRDTRDGLDVDAVAAAAGHARAPRVGPAGARGCSVHGRIQVRVPLPDRPGAGRAVVAVLRPGRGDAVPYRRGHGVHRGG
mmetsp:Transcript_7201/g.31767  ORF Transcript_7201/g.31767 Transcript_7201/m.31767 type:complete len:488 (+) Transcript_7201:422-1885(+)